jgi:hypothetical protein
MNCKHLTITPINRDLKSKSNIDFIEQWVHTRTGELNWCWDDSYVNVAKTGEYFGFMFYGIKVIIHRIIAIHPPSKRLPSWSSNVGQSDRNVLELSDPLKEFTWEEWVENDGPQKRQGTYTTLDLSKNRKKLYNILNGLNGLNGLNSASQSNKVPLTEINETEHSIEEREKAIEEREKAIEEREKAIEEREKAIYQREQILLNAKKMLQNL